LRKRRALLAAGFARTELRRIFPKLDGVTEAGILTTYVVICERGEYCKAAGFERTELRRIFPKLTGVTEAGVLAYVVICERGELASSCKGTK